MYDLPGAGQMTVRAVIGPGLMGHGIALVLAKRPGAVWLYGTSDEILAAGMERIAQSLEQLRRYGLVERADEILARIRPTTDGSPPCSACDESLEEDGYHAQLEKRCGRIQQRGVAGDRCGLELLAGGSLG